MNPTSLMWIYFSFCFPKSVRTKTALIRKILCGKVDNPDLHSRSKEADKEYVIKKLGVSE